MRERVWVGGESLGLSHDQSLINGAQLFLRAKFFGGVKRKHPKGCLACLHVNMQGSLLGACVLQAAQSVASHLEVAWSFTNESIMFCFFKRLG